MFEFFIWFLKLSPLYKPPGGFQLKLFSFSPPSPTLESLELHSKVAVWHIRPHVNLLISVELTYSIRQLQIYIGQKLFFKDLFWLRDRLPSLPWDLSTLLHNDPVAHRIRIIMGDARFEPIGPLYYKSCALPMSHHIIKFYNVTNQCVRKIA